MDKYKVNYIFSEEKDINEIFIRVLSKELKKYSLMICKNKQAEVPSSCTRFSQKEGKN